MSSIIRARINEKIDKITRSCFELQNNPEDGERVLMRLAEAIRQIRTQAEARIVKYKEEFESKFGNRDAYRQKIQQMVKDVQDEKDEIAESSLSINSDIRLIKLEQEIVQKLDNLDKKVQHIANIDNDLFSEIESDNH